MILVLFEDSGCYNLWPLTATIPLYAVKIGPFRVFELWSKLLGIEKVALFCRRGVEEYVDWILNAVDRRNIPVNPDSLDEEILAVNSSYLPLSEALDNARRLRDYKGNVILHRGGRPLMIRASRLIAENLPEALRGVLENELLLSFMGSFEDLPVTGRGEVSSLAEVPGLMEELLVTSLRVRGEGMILVEEGARVEEPVSLKPPVYIGGNVYIEPYTVIISSSIEGPARVSGYIDNSLIGAYSEVMSSRIEKTLLVGANVLGPYSSSTGLDVRAMGFASRVMPSSSLINRALVGITSRVYGVFTGELGSGRVFKWGKVERLHLDSAVEELRKLLLSFGRLPSDYEISYLSEVLERR